MNVSTTIEPVSIMAEQLGHAIDALLRYSGPIKTLVAMELCMRFLQHLFDINALSGHGM